MVSRDAAEPTSPALSAAFTRRGFLGLGVGLAGVGILAACGGGSKNSNSPTPGSSDSPNAVGNAKLEGVTMLHFEGAGQEVVPEKVIKAFESAHSGVTVKSVIGGSRFPEVLSAYKANGTALVNVGLFTAQVMAQGQQLGMFRPLTSASVPRADKADQAYQLFADDGVPFNTNLVGLIYRTDLADPPKSWLDLLDPKYKGKVGLYDAPQGILLGGLWAVNQALGGDPATLDKGFEAFAKAAKEGQFSTVYNSNQTQFDAFSRGDCVIGASIVATQANWAKQGAKIGYVAPTEGQLAVPLYLATVKGSTEGQFASSMELVNEMLKPENVAEYNKLTYAGSVYSDIAPHGEQAELPGFSPEAMKKVQQIDWKQQAEVQAKLVERWNRDIKGNLK
jgi:putative spermidine/putrescine transport system substrate-binding protein